MEMHHTQRGVLYNDADIVYGSRWDDTILGGESDQTFITLGGHDKIDGGWGYDTLKIDELSENITFEVSQSEDKFDWDIIRDGDTLASITNIQEVALLDGNQKIIDPISVSILVSNDKNKDGQPDSSKYFYENRDLLVEIKLDTDSPDVTQDIKSIQLTGLVAPDGSAQKGTLVDSTGNPVGEVTRWCNQIFSRRNSKYIIGSTGS